MKSVDYLTGKGVDIAKALEIFGDIDTYNQTLGDFKSALEEKIPKLTNLKQSHDMANYAIVVHSMKSDAKYFGFFNFAEVAYQHEMAAKEGNATFIEEDFDNLINKAKKVLGIVVEYLGTDDGAGEETKVEHLDTKPEPSNDNLKIDKPTIIVADDSNIVRNFVNSSFKDVYNVLSTEDGQYTIDILNANIGNKNIKCLLLDLNMPRKSGFDVLEFMKEHSLFDMVPVSIITGEASKEGIDNAFKYPVVDMLQKPFTGEDVKNLVTKTIESSDWI